MSEPFYVRQTGEPEHLKDQAAIRAWFEECGKDAYDQGGRYPRYSIKEDGSTALFECWKKLPKDYGEQRWMETWQENPDG